MFYFIKEKVRFYAGCGVLQMSIKVFYHGGYVLLMKSRMMSKGILFLLMAMFVLGGCTVDQEKDEQENSSADEFTEMQNENLQKLCKVWGYVKYRHPVFISGSKDWDEELFQLIEETMNLEDEQEMNELLNDWLKSLGETESYKQRDDSVLADTS